MDSPLHITAQQLSVGGTVSWKKKGKFHLLLTIGNKDISAYHEVSCLILNFVTVPFLLQQMLAMLG